MQKNKTNGAKPAKMSLVEAEIHRRTSVEDMTAVRQVSQAEHDQAVREHNRDLYAIRHVSEERCGSDILVFIGIFVAAAVILAVAWILWAVVLSTPAHPAGPGPGLILPLGGLLANFPFLG